MNGLELKMIILSGMHCLLTYLTRCGWVICVIKPLAPYAITMIVVLYRKLLIMIIFTLILV